MRLQVVSDRIGTVAALLDGTIERRLSPANQVGFVLRAEPLESVCERLLVSFRQVSHSLIETSCCILYTLAASHRPCLLGERTWSTGLLLRCPIPHSRRWL